MAARKTRPPASRNADAAPPDASVPPVDSLTSPNAVRRSHLALAAGLFAIWFAALATLALLSANPVTLNREQIRRADVVVEARVENRSTGQCRVIQTWPAGKIDETITVRGLADLSVVKGRTYLMPLERDEHGAGYHIFATAPPESEQLVYPADDEARRQLEEIIGGEEPETM